MVLVIVVVSIKAVMLGDDVVAVRTKGFGLARFHVLALWVALPVTVLPEVQAFPCLLAGCVGP